MPSDLTEKKGLVLSMLAHEGNRYDGHLLKEAKEKEKNARRVIERILVDKGFRRHGVENAHVLTIGTRGLTKSLKKL